MPWMKSPTWVEVGAEGVDGVEHALATGASGVVDALRKRTGRVLLVELHRVDEGAADVDGEPTAAFRATRELVHGAQSRLRSSARTVSHSGACGSISSKCPAPSSETKVTSSPAARAASR